MTKQIPPNAVLSSAEYIVQNADHVKINIEKLNQYADTIEFKEVEHWIHSAPLDFSKLNESETLIFVFMFNTLSFSYWGSGDQPDYHYVKDGEVYKTSWGLMAALRDGILSKQIPVDMFLLSKIKDDELGVVINKDVTMPLFDKRCEILRGCANFISEQYKGDLKDFFLSGEGDVNNLVNIIYDNFPGYQDSAEYKNRTVYFLKKAQILIADMYRLFGTSFAHLSNPETITACADYRLPQLMREEGIIEYDEELTNTVDNVLDIPSGSAYEVEIRGSTIWVNELIKRFLENKYQKNLLAVDVNDFLWIASKARGQSARPYHRTRTLMY